MATVILFTHAQITQGVNPSINFRKLLKTYIKKTFIKKTLKKRKVREKNESKCFYAWCARPNACQQALFFQVNGGGLGLALALKVIGTKYKKTFNGYI